MGRRLRPLAYGTESNAESDADQELRHLLVNALDDRHETRVRPNRRRIFPVVGGSKTRGADSRGSFHVDKLETDVVGDVGSCDEIFYERVNLGISEDD
jgi:hypothetical protein